MRFWSSADLEELAKEQGVRPLQNPDDLAGGFPADEDIDEFIDSVNGEEG
jgi:hypothetical protein